MPSLSPLHPRLAALGALAVMAAATSACVYKPQLLAAWEPRSLIEGPAAQDEESAKKREDRQCRGEVRNPPKLTLGNLQLRLTNIDSHRVQIHAIAFLNHAEAAARPKKTRDLAVGAYRNMQMEELANGGARVVDLTADDLSRLDSARGRCVLPRYIHLSASIVEPNGKKRDEWVAPYPIAGIARLLPEEAAACRPIVPPASTAATEPAAPQTQVEPSAEKRGCTPLPGPPATAGGEGG